MSSLLSWLLVMVWIASVQVEAFTAFSVRGMVRAHPVRTFHRPTIHRGATPIATDRDNIVEFHGDYEKLPRSELQKLAKQNNIKANAKSSDIIAALCQLNTTPHTTTTPAAEDEESPEIDLPEEEEYIVSGVADSELDTVARILAMQGISWGDISSAKAAHLDPNRPKRVSIKRGKKPKESPTASQSGTRGEVPGVPGVTHLGTTISSRDIQVPAIMKKRLRPLDEENNRDDGYRRGVRRGDSFSSGGRMKDRYGDRTRPYDDEREEFNAQHRAASNKYTNYNTYPSQNTDTHTTPTYATRTTAPPTPPRISLDNTTLKSMLEYLIGKVGYPALHSHTHLRCFIERPTMASSLKVLRQEDMAWARGKVEHLYITEKKKDALAER